MEHELDGWMTMVWRVLIGIETLCLRREKEEERGKEKEDRGGEKAEITVKHY